MPSLTQASPPENTKQVLPRPRFPGENGGLRWASKCIGIDIVDGNPVAVLAERKRGGRILCTPLHGKGALPAGAGKHPPMAVALSCRESFTHWLEAPLASRRKAARVLPTLLDIQLPFPVEDCLCNFIGIHRSKEKNIRALAVAARRIDVKQRLETLLDADIDPAALDQQGLALWTQAQEEAPPRPGSATRVIVHCDTEHAALVMGRNGSFLSAHPLRKTDATHINRFLHAEIGKCVDPIEWIWTGAVRPNIRPEDQSALLNDWPGRSVPVDNPETFLARAVATRALTDGPLRVNLRTGPLLHDAIKRHDARQALRSAVLLLIAGLFLTGFSLSVGWMARQQRAQMQRAIADLSRDLAGFPVAAKGKDAIRIIEHEIEERKARLRPFVQMLSFSLTEALHKMAQTADARDIRLDSVVLSLDACSISGTAPDWESPETLLRAVVSSGYNVDLKRGETGDDGRASFQIGSEAKP